MTIDWPVIRFGKLCDHSAFGPRFSSDEYSATGNVACLRTMDITANGEIDLKAMPLAQLDANRFNQHFLQLDDLVITRTGAYLGKVAVFEGFRLPVLAGAFLIRFQLNTEALRPHYARYYFNSPTGQQQIQSIVTGSVQPNLNITNLHTLEIPVPPIVVQERIIDIVKSLDDKIELNRRMNETLEAMARRLFKSWFIDFDPVHRNAAKLAGRSVKVETSPTSDFSLPTSNFDHLFPNTFEDSILGPIPTGWKVGTVGDIGNNPRRSIQPSEISASTPYIALEHMPRRCIALSEWGYAEDVASGKFRFHEGEILFGKLRPYFHKVGVPAINGVCSTDVLVILPNENHWFGVLLGHVSSDEMIAHTDKSSTGTKMPRTNWGDIARFEIAIPTKEIAEAANVHIKQLVDRIHTNIFESRCLTRTRDKLLPRLLSGDLQILQESALR